MLLYSDDTVFSVKWFGVQTGGHDNLQRVLSQLDGQFLKFLFCIFLLVCLAFAPAFGFIIGIADDTCEADMIKRL